MGQYGLDQFSLLHAASGVIAYFWGVTFYQWIILHTIFEIAENTPQGIHFINHSLLLWPGGKPGQDSVVNILGDTVATSFGWYVAYALDHYGASNGWIRPDDIIYIYSIYTRMLPQIVVLATMFTLIDVSYLWLVSSHFKKMLFRVQGGRGMEFDIAAAVLCYIALVALLWWYIIRERKSPWEAALLGFLVYAVYETTNKATLKDWSWQFLVMDSIWGGILFGTTTYLFYYVQDIKLT